jgi:hypothetical protein
LVPPFGQLGNAPFALGHLNNVTIEL